MSDIVKLIGIEIGDLIASGPAAKWSEMDQSIWLWIRDGALDPVLGFGDEGWADRILKALFALNQIESGAWEVVETNRKDES